MTQRPRSLPMLLRALCVLVCALWFTACSDAELTLAPPAQSSPLDNRLSIQADVCLSNPGEVVFPVKVVFVIDTSTSMEISDPVDPMQLDPALQTGRSRAVTQVLNNFRDQPGFEVAMIKFGASANVVTNCGMAGPCFIPNTTANQGALTSAVFELNVASGTTDYQSAVDATFQLISDDLKRQKPVSLARSRYLVIFMSDGLPFPQLADSNNQQTITGTVNNLMVLRAAFGVGDIRVHTALLATDKPDFIRAQEEVVLKAMAKTGKGLYRSFENGESINFLSFGLTSLRRAFTLRSFVAQPLNTVAAGALGRPVDPRSMPGVSLSEGGQLGGLLVDSDGDGIADVIERTLGTSAISSDTDRDGFSDQLEYRFRSSGFDPLNPGDADCGQPDDKGDDDGDGVRNCEERFLGTSRFLVDSDGDGLPDGLELRAGTDPTSRDVIVDTDQDGTNNLAEVLAHNDPLRPDAANRSLVAQRYNRRDLTPAEQPLAATRPCLQVVASNVQLLQTLPGGLFGARDTVGGWNRILLWAGEAPFDDDNDKGSWRVACVQGRFFNNGDKFPATGSLVVSLDKFVPVDAGVLDTLQCIGPGPDQP